MTSATDSPAVRPVQNGEVVRSSTVDPAGDAIAVDHLLKRFRKTTAVDDISFRLPRGSICGFLGPNGAGKTSTIRMLMGLQPTSAGSVRVLGLDPMRQRDALLRR